MSIVDIYARPVFGLFLGGKIVIELIPVVLFPALVNIGKVIIRDPVLGEAKRGFGFSSFLQVKSGQRPYAGFPLLTTPCLNNSLAGLELNVYRAYVAVVATHRAARPERSGW